MLDIAAIAKNSKNSIADGVDYEKMERKIDLEKLFGRIGLDSLCIRMNTCPALYSLHSSSSNDLDVARLEESRSLIQVTAGNRALILDLHEEVVESSIFDIFASEEEVPIPAVKEHSALDQLIDPENYVETGVRVGYLERSEAKSGQVCTLIRVIETNNDGSHYFLKQE